MAVRGHHQGSYLGKVGWQGRGSIISGTLGVLQTHVLGLQVGRDLPHAGHPVLRVVLLVVIHRLVNEEDPVVKMFMGGRGGWGSRFVLLEVISPLEIVSVHLGP